MDLDVVVVNWNGGDHLVSLLDSLEPLSGELGSVRVIDNASEDGSERSAVRPWVQLVRSPRNLGFAGAANLGVRAGRSEWVLLMNPDVRIFRESLRGLYRVARKHPEAGIVCGALVGPEGGGQEDFQIRRLPTLWSAVAENLFFDELVKKRRTPGPGLGPRSVEQPAAACWLLRRQAWKDVDGFDESFYPAWFEDVDFCRRVGRRGWEILYFPEFVFEHVGGSSVTRLGYKEFLRIYRRNELRYWRKHHPSTWWLVWLPNRVGLVLRLVAVREPR